MYLANTLSTYLSCIFLWHPAHSFTSDTFPWTPAAPPETGLIILCLLSPSRSDANWSLNNRLEGTGCSMVRLSINITTDYPPWPAEADQFPARWLRYLRQCGDVSDTGSDDDRSTQITIITETGHHKRLLNCPFIPLDVFVPSAVFSWLLLLDNYHSFNLNLTHTFTESTNFWKYWIRTNTFNYIEESINLHFLWFWQVSSFCSS